MGALHEGHLRLVDRARESADLVVMSVFVNPLQFGPTEDFAKYPRDLDRDRALARERGVDCLFGPDRAAMYPAEPLTRIDPGPLAERFEGTIRPGHFGGVLTVVAKLFHLLEPDVAVFGRKDFQQAALIRRMVRDLDFPIDIVIAPTVRELDGLALSSRNAYLNADQRRMALGLSRTLRTVEQLWRGGDADPVSIRTQGLLVLSAAGVTPDYLALVDGELRDVERVTASAVAIVAGKVGTTRLLDNVILGEGVSGDPSVRKP
jgi:pantoate--beta-alanine ligase